MFARAYSTMILRMLAAFLLAIGLTQAPALASQAPSRGVELANANSAAIGVNGPYYALIIGNNDYQFLPHLETATNDAQAMERLLHNEFGFGTTLLLNATRSDILNAFAVYREKLPENSHLLIYYAGHGKNDAEARVAYWLPVDAHPVNSANWISSEDITAELRVIKSRHVLIVADSCYSGAMMRGAEYADLRAELKPAELMVYMAKLDRIQSRNLMASGGVEPVADSGAGGHSIFAGVILQTLHEMSGPEFTGAAVFQKVVVRVSGRSQQTPQYNGIVNSAHDGGDFIFYRQPGRAPTSLCCLVETTPDHGRTTAQIQGNTKEELEHALQTYCSAYQQGDINTLRSMWPSISSQKIKNLQTFLLPGRRSLSLDCSFGSEPQILGNSATVDIVQLWTYTVAGKTTKVPPEKARMKLKKVDDAAAGADWLIEWIQ